MRRKHNLSWKTILMLFMVATLLSGCTDDSPEAELSRANKATQAAQAAADRAESNLSRLEELIDKYDKMQEKISKLKDGTPEFEAAIQENNRLVRQMISEFPELGEYVEVN